MISIAQIVPIVHTTRAKTVLNRSLWSRLFFIADHEFYSCSALSLLRIRNRKFLPCFFGPPQASKFLSLRTSELNLGDNLPCSLPRICYRPGIAHYSWFRYTSLPCAACRYNAHNPPGSMVLSDHNWYIWKTRLSCVLRYPLNGYTRKIPCQVLPSMLRSVISSLVSSLVSCNTLQHKGWLLFLYNYSS